MRRECECGCGRMTSRSFIPGHEAKALRMLLHLEGVLGFDEPVVEFLHRRGYGRHLRNLHAGYHDRALRRPGGLAEIAERVGRDVLGRPVPVGREHRGPLRTARPPEEPGVYALYAGGRPVYVGRISNLRDRLLHHKSSSPRLSTLALKMARIKVGKAANKGNKTASGGMHLYHTSPAFREAFDEAVDRIRAMHVRYVALPEDEDAGAAQALVALHAAVELDTLELCGGGGDDEYPQDPRNSRQAEGTRHRPRMGCRSAVGSAVPTRAGR